MTDYLELTMQGGAIGISILVVLFLIVAVLMVVKLARKTGRSKETRLASATATMPTKTKNINISLKETIVSALKEAKEAETKKPSILGTGQYKCMCYRPGNVIDFTTIPEPIGEMYQFDTSCPFSGGGYIVKELDTGQVVDYDPREVEIIIGEMPEYAWFATHWDIVKQVFNVPLSWLRSPATWFAAATLVIMFVLGLVTLGG